MTSLFVYDKTDSGNCRIYYRSPRRLCCFQETFDDKFELFSCSKDGEPSHSIPHLGQMLDMLPEDGSSTAVRFRAWFEDQDKIGMAPKQTKRLTEKPGV